MGDLMHILETAVNAVVPVVLIVLLGYCLKEKGFLSKEFIHTFFYIIFPN